MPQTKQVDHPKLDDPVTIWKMNYGFRQDFSNEVLKVDVQGEGQQSMNVMTGDMNLYWLVFGIFQAPSLNIQQPNDVRRGLSDREVKDRLANVRTMDMEVAEHVKDKIMDLNNETEGDEQDQEEVAKK